MQRCTTLLFARNKKHFSSKNFSSLLLETIGNCRSVEICIDKLNMAQKLKPTAWYVLYRLVNIFGLQSKRVVFMSHTEQIPDECLLLNCTQALLPQVLIILGQFCARVFLKKQVETMEL